MPGKRQFSKKCRGSSSSGSSSGSRDEIHKIKNGRVASKKMKAEKMDDCGKYFLDKDCDSLSEFVRTGRTGRRNALPPSTQANNDLTKDPISYVQVSDLPDTLAKLSCSSTKMSDINNTSEISPTGNIQKLPAPSEVKLSSSSKISGMAYCQLPTKN